MAQLIDRSELALVLDEAIPAEKFDAAYKMALRAVRTAYAGDPEEATGNARYVVEGVLQNVITRILTNPRGVRTLGLGSANTTFGGTDVEITRTTALTAEERSDLEGVSPTRRRTGAFTINPLGV